MYNVSLCCIIILIRGDFCENLFMKAGRKAQPTRPFSGQGMFWLLQALCISHSFCCSQKLSQGQIWHFQVQISELLCLQSPFQVLLCGCVFERQRHAVPYYDIVLLCFLCTLFLFSPFYLCFALHLELTGSVHRFAVCVKVALV